MAQRYAFELAMPEDSAEILEVLEDCSFTGDISLLYTRRPDPYTSLKREGKEIDIVVCRDTKKQKIAGVGNCATRWLFIDGAPQKVGYLFGLRARQEYRGLPILPRGYRFLCDLHRDRGIQCYFTTILGDSIAVQKMLEKRRPNMPSYSYLGGYRMYACLPRKKAKKRPPYHFAQAQAHDKTELIEFLRRRGSEYQFFPVVDEGFFNSEKFPALEEFYLVRDDWGNLLAAGAIWDRQRDKQYIVQGYGGVLKWLSPLFPIFPLFGFPALPRPGNPMNFCYVASWIGDERDPESFSCFVDGISERCREYSFFLLGIHERSPLCPIVASRPHILYHSRLYQVAWGEQRRLDPGLIPYVECAML